MSEKLVVANQKIREGFDDVIGDALEGREIRYVENFKPVNGKVPLDTYATMITCAADELPDKCIALGASSASKVRELIDGRPNASVTFLAPDIYPRIDSIQEKDGVLTCRGYFDFGVDG